MHAISSRNQVEVIISQGRRFHFRGTFLTDQASNGQACLYVTDQDVRKEIVIKNTLLSIALTSLLAVIMASCGQLVPTTELIQSSQTVDRAGFEATPSTTATAVEAEGSAALLPNGFASEPHDGLGLSFLGLARLALGEIRVPTQAWVSKNTLHIAGPNAGSLNFPLVYFQPSIEGNCDGCGLWLLDHDQSSQLLHFNDIKALIGVPGADLVAFVERLSQADGLR